MIFQQSRLKSRRNQFPLSQLSGAIKGHFHPQDFTGPRRYPPRRRNGFVFGIFFPIRVFMKSIAHQGVQSPFNIKKKLNENGLSLREKAQMVPKIPKIHNLFSDLSLLSHSHDTYDCDNQSFPYYSSDIEQRSITNAPKTHLHPIERSGKPKPWQAPISTEFSSFDSMVCGLF